MKYNLSDIARICAGELHGKDIEIRSISTDSRSYASTNHTLFVAICGRNHDSHQYIEQMIERGTCAFITEQNWQLPTNNEIGYIKVASSIEALQALAAHHRAGFKGEVVAITGSNGKTTIKEWLAESLPSDIKIFRSPKSYNSQLGVALSLLMTEGDEQLAIIEAGISQVGEMERLERMIKPDCVIFTSIGDAHEQGFDSLQQKIEQKLLLAASAKQIIYNSEYKELREAIERLSNIETIDAHHLEGAAHFSDSASKRNSQIVEAFLLSRHFPTSTLPTLNALAMRLELKEGVNDSIIIDDSYNCDINSLGIALDYLHSVAAQRRKVLILSEILQSAQPEEELYKSVGQAIQDAGVSLLIGIGDSFKRHAELFTCPCIHVGSTDELLQRLNQIDFAHAAILIKGNRASRTERIAHALQKRSHTTTLEVNLDNMVANLNIYRSKLKPSMRLVAMVKANSYGAGGYQIAQELQNQGVDFLAVAFTDEGIALREGGVTMPIIVLNADDESFAQMIQYRLEPEIYSLRSLRSFAEQAQRYTEQILPIHLKLDTGMHRLGFCPDQIEELTAEFKRLSHTIHVETIFTHLCCADMPEQREFTTSQIELFTTMCNQISDSLGYSPLRHTAATAAIENYNTAQFDICRLGIGLYGFSSNATFAQQLTPISILRSRIVQIKHLAKGESVGYARSERLERDSIIATIPIGYADGLDRHLSNRLWSMLIAGKCAPIVGRICMDSCMVDITDIEGVQEGDIATIFSTQSGNRASDMAQQLETITYEVLTSVSSRVKRVYIKE